MSEGFTILRRLGAGGMAEVFLAERSRGGGPERVALKRLREGTEDRAEHREHFRREARIGAMLSHPNIVALKDFGVDARGPWLAFELIEGRTSSQLLRAHLDRSELLPLPAGISILRDVGAALDHAHRFRPTGDRPAGVIHRDVSPDNVLVGFDGVAKLTDFGIARFAAGTTLTVTGTTKGKFGYIAPEQLEGHPADVLTDLFSFGATAYRLLAGVHAFQGKTDGERVRSVLLAEPSSLKVHRSDIPSDLTELVMACLAKDPALRPRSARSVVEVLERHAHLGNAPVRKAMRWAFPTLEPFAAEDEAVSEEAKPGAQAVTKTFAEGARAPRRRWKRWLGAFGAVAVVAGTALFALRGTRSSAPQTVEGSGIAAVPPGSGEASQPLAVQEPAITGQTPAVQQQAVPGGGGMPAPDTSASAPRASAPDPRAAGGSMAAAPKPGEARRAKKGSSKPDARGEPGSARRKGAGGATASAETARSTGKLWIKVAPWAVVFVDGRRVGDTPLEPLELSPGPHSVILVNESLGVRRVEQVNVVAGEQVVLRVQLP